MQIKHKLNVNDANYSAESVTKKVGKSRRKRGLKLGEKQNDRGVLPYHGS